MEWALASEQARELVDSSREVAYAQAVLLEHRGTFTNDYMENSNLDRLFFYVFDGAGEIINSARISAVLEPFVLEIIDNWQGQEGEVVVFSRSVDKHETILMLTSHTIFIEDLPVGVVYIGKDVSALYSGLEKATYTVMGIAFFALILATWIGYFMSGKAIIPLKEAYEKQRQFAADASHELRTPLSVIMAAADILANDKSITSPFLKQLVGDVKDEVKKMTRLVSDLLLVARSESMEIKLKIARINLSEYILQTVRIMKPLAEKKNITLSFDLQRPFFIHADEQQIKQLLVILVDNAIKYTELGGEITLGLTALKNNIIRLSVKDTGKGISKADAEKIFDRFYRVDKVRSREMGGNGLGLSIAKEIVKAHGGKIFVESNLGEGSTFFVDFTLLKK